MRATSTGVGSLLMHPTLVLAKVLLVVFSGSVYGQSDPRPEAPAESTRQIRILNVFDGTPGPGMAVEVIEDAAGLSPTVLLIDRFLRAPRRFLVAAKGRAGIYSTQSHLNRGTVAGGSYLLPLQSSLIVVTSRHTDFTVRGKCTRTRTLSLYSNIERTFQPSRVPPNSRLFRQRWLRYMIHH